MGSTSAVATPAATCRPHANKPTETIINKRRSLDDYYTFLSDNNGEQNMSLRDKQSWPTEITSHKKKGKNESLPGKFIGPGESADIVWRLIRFNVPFRNKTHKSFVLDAVGSAKERRVLTWLTRTRITVRSRLPRSFGTEPTHFFRPPPLRSAPRIAADNWNVDTTREKEFKIAVGNSENTKKKKKKVRKENNRPDVDRKGYLKSYYLREREREKYPAVLSTTTNKDNRRLLWLPRMEAG